MQTGYLRIDRQLFKLRDRNIVYLQNMKDPKLKVKNTAYSILNVIIIFLERGNDLKFILYLNTKRYAYKRIPKNGK